MFRLTTVCYCALLLQASGQISGSQTQGLPPKSKATPQLEPSTEGPTKASLRPKYGRPATLGTDALQEFETLPKDRKLLIASALAVATDSPWLPYKFGGSNPGDGGFDCSGAMYFVLRKTGLTPPRSSAEQYLWVRNGGHFQKLKPGIHELEHPLLSDLRPGDLLFWGGTYAPIDDRTVKVTHVALFLGHEKKDGRAVMLNATDGRAYRGKKANGFGVYDFQLPREGSRAVFMGYGTPPGIKPMVAP